MMLLFVEGPDKAGKTTLMRELALDCGFSTFSVRYPSIVFEDDEESARPTDYFLGANTFLIEAYKAHKEHLAGGALGLDYDLAVHRGFLSEFVYGPLFGRRPKEFLTRWWVDQWPKDAAMVLVNIPHEVYMARATGDAEPDTIPLMAPARWKVIQDRYQMAVELVHSMGRDVTRISGEATFERQLAVLQLLPAWSS